MDCWLRELERAGTEEEVVACTRDFLALWSASELAPLTLGWRDLRIEGAADVERMKHWIDETYWVATLRPLGDYLWHAVARLDKIRSSPRIAARHAPQEIHRTPMGAYGTPGHRAQSFPQ